MRLRAILREIARVKRRWTRAAGQNGIPAAILAVALISSGAELAKGEYERYLDDFGAEAAGVPADESAARLTYREIRRRADRYQRWRHAMRVSGGGGGTPGPVVQQDVRNYLAWYALPDFNQNADISGVVVAAPVTGATNASPIVLTVPTAGMTEGRRVKVQGVGGNTNANGYAQIHIVDANHLQLLGVSGNGAYTSGGTVTQGLCDVSQALLRLRNNSQPGIDASAFFTSGAPGGGTVVQPPTDLYARHLADLGIVNGANVTDLIWPSQNVNMAWPSTLGQNAAGLRFWGGGVSGAITFTDPLATHLQKWNLNSFHGSFDFRNWVFVGDQTLAASVTDADIAVSISGFWNTTIEDNQFVGMQCTSAVLQTTGNTGGSVWQRNHFTGSGLRNQGAVQTTGIWSMQGSEGGTLIARNVFVDGQLAGYNFLNKNNGLSPHFAIAEEEAAGTPSGTGYIFEDNFHVSPGTAAMAIQPIAAGSVVGHVTIRHCHFYQNCVNANGAGCINGAGTNQILSVLIEHCFFNLNNGTANPAVNFPAASGLVTFEMRDCEVDLNFKVIAAATQKIRLDSIAGGVYVLVPTANNLIEIVGCVPGVLGGVSIDLSGATTKQVWIEGCDLSAGTVKFNSNVSLCNLWENKQAATVDVTVSKPGKLVETISGITSDYRTDSGAGVGANLLVVYSGTATNVKVAPHLTVLAQDVVGVTTAAGLGVGGYGPVQRLGQSGVVVSNDAAGAIAVGNKLAPSTTVDGKIVLDVTASNTIAVAEAAMAVSTTGAAYMRAA